MAKYSYLWRTNDKQQKEIFIPMKLGKKFEKQGMVTFVGKFFLTITKTGETILEKVGGKK